MRGTTGVTSRKTADAGQGLVEYGLILGLAALVTVIALVFFGGALATALSLLGQAIDSSS
jgi:Flp pilus assembly pilin Flp